MLRIQIYVASVAMVILAYSSTYKTKPHKDIILDKLMELPIEQLLSATQKLEIWKA